MRLSEIDITEQDKEILANTIKPKTIPEICAKTNLQYSTIAQKLSVFAAKNWVKKEKTMSGKTLYVLNQDQIQL